MADGMDGNAAAERTLLDLSAELYGCDPETARQLAGNSGDYVYEVVADGVPRILRIASSRWMAETVTARRAQMVFQRKLAACSRDDILFSSPLPSRDGHLVEPVEIDDRVPEWHAILFEKLPGEVMRGFDLQDRFDLEGDEELRRWCYATMGRATGIMHACAKRHEVWMEHEKRGVNGRRLSPAGWASISAFLDDIARDDPEISTRWEALKSALAKIGQPRTHYGLAHADVSLTNLLLIGRALGVIDHVSVFLWYLYDVACPFMRADEWRHGDPQRCWGDFIESYAAETSLPKDWQRVLRLANELRRFSIYLIVASRVSSGRGDRDAHRVAKWRRDITAGVPPVTAISFH